MALVLDPRMRRILANLRKLEAETTGFARYKVCAYCGEFERVDFHAMSDLELLGVCEVPTIEIVPVMHTCWECGRRQQTQPDFWEDLVRRIGYLTPGQLEDLVALVKSGGMV